MTIENWTCPMPLRDHPTIVMGHGGGGQLSAELIEHLFVPAFGNGELAELADAAVLDLEGSISFSTDTFTVHPRFFPGGDIGELAINGTVNDVAMRGAVPRYLSVGLVLEEGLLMSALDDKEMWGSDRYRGRMDHQRTSSPVSSAALFPHIPTLALVSPLLASIAPRRNARPGDRSWGWFLRGWRRR